MTSISRSSAFSCSTGFIIPAFVGVDNSIRISSEFVAFSISIRNRALKAMDISSPVVLTFHPFISFKRKINILRCQLQFTAMNTQYDLIGTLITENTYPAECTLKVIAVNRQFIWIVCMVSLLYSQGNVHLSAGNSFVIRQNSQISDCCYR